MRQAGWTIAGPIALLLVAMLPRWGDTAERMNVELIIDASGSMAAKVDGRQKMAHAKDALLSTLKGTIPLHAQVAVRAYGHHRKEDCHDLELLVPFGPRDPARIRKKVQALRPVGMTPISGALEAAGEDFAGREGQHNMIILVSDGKETCQGDPCAVARRLHEAGIKVTINVVGYDVAPEERHQLVCIAEAAGGKYYNADTVKELKEAFRDVGKQIAQVAPPPAPVKPPSSPKKSNLLDPKNGGQVMIAPYDFWAELIDGKEDPAGLQRKWAQGFLAHVFRPGEEAIFAFKDEEPATFDTFSVLIPNTGNNLKEFELFVADDSLAGPFGSIGKFQTLNAKVIPKKDIRSSSSLQ